MLFLVKYPWDSTYQLILVLLGQERERKEGRRKIKALFTSCSAWNKNSTPRFTEPTGNSLDFLKQELELIDLRLFIELVLLHRRKYARGCCLVTRALLPMPEKHSRLVPKKGLQSPYLIQVRIDPYLSSDRDSIAIDRGFHRDGFYIIRKGIALIDCLRQLIDAR